MTRLDCTEWQGRWTYDIESRQLAAQSKEQCLTHKCLSNEQLQDKQVRHAALVCDREHLRGLGRVKHKLAGTGKRQGHTDARREGQLASLEHKQVSRP